MVNIGNMMKQAQQLQQKMADAQEKLNSIEVEGESGGGVVKVTATAKGEIKRINLDQSLLKPEDKEITEDLIQEQKEIDQMKDDPEVKNLLDSFPGIKIHSITNIKETIAEQEEKIQTSTQKEK